MDRSALGRPAVHALYEAVKQRGALLLYPPQALIEGLFCKNPRGHFAADRTRSGMLLERDRRQVRFKTAVRTRPAHGTPPWFSSPTMLLSIDAT